MKTWFISDLHLDASRPQIIQLFLDFLDTIKPQADALYILGDLFEYWIGDDALDLPSSKPFIPVISKLQELSDFGIKLYFIAGNRDFLIDKQFADKTGCEILADEKIIDLYGTKTLIMHGDTLCTDDVEYLKLRALIRSEKWQTDFLSLSIEERIKEAQKLRDASKEQTASKPEEIMDVNQQSVEDTMNKWSVTQLIHGHTHRMATHQFVLNKQPVNRIVLGDWYNDLHYLSIDKQSQILR